MRLQITREYEPEENPREPFALTFQIILTPAEEDLVTRCGEANLSGAWPVADLRKGIKRRYRSASQALADEPLARTACEALIEHLRDVQAWHGLTTYEFSLEETSAGGQRV